MSVGDGVVWNEALPDDNVVANQIDDYDRDLRIGVRSRMAVEHIWPASQTGTGQAGMHSFITFQQQTAAPTLVVASGQVGALCVGSSAAGYPLVFENSAGDSYTLVNSEGKIPVISGGTQGGIVICSSASPTGLVVLVASAPGLALITNTGTGAPTWGYPSGQFGTWGDKSSSHDSQVAATDGIVTANGSGEISLSGYTDASNPPETIRQKTSSVTGQYCSITFPVKKGHYWKVTGDGGGSVTSVFWLPVGA